MGKRSNEDERDEKKRHEEKGTRENSEFSVIQFH